MVLTMILSACQEVPKRDLAGVGISEGATGGSTGGVGVTTSGSNGGVQTVSAAPKVEIRNLVEPNITTADYPTYFTGTGLSGAGTYVRKLTLPKNYQGLLYLGGININSLSGRFVKVRFTFGVSGEQVEVDATVARAPGITPNTEIDVLVMDLRNQPFSNMRLIYDLYDYRDYSDPTNLPVETNRDPSLYCRALRLQDDNTFNGQGECDGLNSTKTGALDEKCLYTYAKVVDRALVQGTTAVYPTQPHIDLTSGKLGYYHQTPQTLMNRCLPDQSRTANHVIVSGVSDINTGGTGVQPLIFTDFNQTANLVQKNAAGTTIFTQAVSYFGPFQAINADNWEIKYGAAFGEFGIFDFTKAFVAPYTNFGVQMGQTHLHYSKMFPRFGYLDLPTDVKYLKTDFNGSVANSQDVKTPTTQVTGGATELVDGCSLRVQSQNYEGNHIGSCNASGKIEILTLNEDGTLITVAESKDVVLQLVRPTQITGEGNDYLYSNYKSCTNSNQCGSGECCFNNRCWNNELVTQCVEQANTVGNSPIGATCSSDFQCSSLCCNLSTGRCGVHDNTLSPPVLCSKPYGQFCLAKEWCQKSNVTNCFIVKTGTDPQGNVTCAKRCYNSQEFGDCKAGVCQPPPVGQNPTFNPSDPNACADAIDPPDL
jgi:hypothetical protein